MSRRSIVIVGAGHAGVQAAVSLREEGNGDEIVLLSGEAELPYQRPPLSKAFLKGAMDLAGLPLRAGTILSRPTTSICVSASGPCASTGGRSASSLPRAGRPRSTI